MFNKWFTKKKQANTVQLVAPLTGKILPLEEVPDPVFAQKMAGDGIAIQPAEGVLRAPVAGRVAHLFPTHHALSLVSEEGLELLIHIGIDTVKLDGKGFRPQVSVGDQVKAGDKLMEFDLSVIQEAGLSPITPIIITNSANKVEAITFGKGASVQAGVDQAMDVHLK